MIKKKAICKKCNSTKARCDYCSSIFVFSGIKGHIAHKETDFPRGVCLSKELESTKRIKTVNEIIKSNTIDGEASAKPFHGSPKTHKSNIIDKSDSIDRSDAIDKSDSIDKSNSIDGEA